MVVMFVDCCVCVVEYFWYYSYSRNPTRQEFFVPAGTLIAVKLLTCHRRGKRHHHGGDVCGGSCVDARRISSTIPIVGNIRGGSFPFPPEP